MTAQRQSLLQRSPRKLYVPGVREPLSLPDERIEIPAPPPLPHEPPKFSWLTMVTPTLTAAITLVIGLFNPIALGLGVPMFIVSLVHPALGYFRYQSQLGDHRKALAARARGYQKQLGELRQHAAALSQEQVDQLGHAYPPPEALVEIAQAAGRYRRLWFRRLGIDSDFLRLRAGTYNGAPTFSLEAPRPSTQADALVEQAYTLQTEFSSINELPFTIPLNQVGSLGIVGSSDEVATSFAHRLLLDAFVHHAPTDLFLFILSNRVDAEARWEFAKWLPHTRSIFDANSPRGLALTKSDIRELVRWLAAAVETRRQFAPDELETDPELPVFLTVLDDDGAVRQMPELARLIRLGHSCRMPALLLGEQSLPQIRARIDVDQNRAFRYVETWEGGNKAAGTAEVMSQNDIQQSARALARLEMAGGSQDATLPDSISLSGTIENLWFTQKAVENNWETDYADNQLLQFPLGVTVSRDGLAPLEINLLPAERGGQDAYHSILIGTTGSGKSEFMKSVVLGAAYRYPPDLLNFFFMDFKGGAAFDIFKDLPHVTGVVTNLQPELVERGLVAVQSEIARRQARFSEEKVRDIWAYNSRAGATRIPHLWLLLDEFAKGVTDFPELTTVLDLLVRQGRSLGMYLLLANQEVTAAVDKLLSNVGWRIALKVARRDEMQQILEERLQPANRPGHGFLRAPNGEIFEFQSGYAGYLVNQEGETRQTEDFSVFLVASDGRRQLVYSHDAKAERAAQLPEELPTEQESLIDLMSHAAAAMKLEPAHGIYLDPLPAAIPLGELLADLPAYRRFEESAWTAVQSPEHFLRVAAGRVDHVLNSIQEPLVIDFREKDGHLWLLGAPGSGKEQVVTTLLLSLAATHLPEEVQFHVIEGGTGSMAKLGALPHTGAVVRVTERERLLRLLDMVEGEMRTRQAEGMDARTAGARAPHLFLVINNFAELRADNLDYLDRIGGFIQGGRVGIHLILVTGLARDLPSKISNNIARKIVLQLANKDEYLNFITRQTPPLSVTAPGRGYWVDDGEAEVQIAQPALQDHEHEPLTFADSAARMEAHWDGPRPALIHILPDIVAPAQLSAALAGTEDVIPVGLNYDDLTPIAPNRADVAAGWVVLGETRSGKSNFLLTLLAHLTRSAAGAWSAEVLCLRPSPLRQLAGRFESVRVHMAQEGAVAALQEAITRLEDPKPLTQPLLVLVDDLGAAFEPGAEPVDRILDQLAVTLRKREAQDVLVVAAGQLDEFRMKASGNTLVRMLSQNKTGLCFSQDMQTWGWLGATPQDVRPYGKLTLPPGRGYFMGRGRTHLVQTPLAEDIFAAERNGA